jgi:hypothetical protein
MLAQTSFPQPRNLTITAMQQNSMRENRGSIITQSDKGRQMNWAQIKRFCFTYAIMGGAWLEDSTGYKSWESESTIARHLGGEWYRAMIRKQGMFTGCWIDVA